MHAYKSEDFKSNPGNVLNQYRNDTLRRKNDDSKTDSKVSLE